MKGEWRCAAPGLLPLQAQAAQAAAAFEAIDFAYIPRAENARVRRVTPSMLSIGRLMTVCASMTDALVMQHPQADALANRAMDLRQSFDAVHVAIAPHAAPTDAA